LNIAKVKLNNCKLSYRTFNVSIPIFFSVYYHWSTSHSKLQTFDFVSLQEEAVMPTAIGIDLGTTNTVVAVWKNNKLETINNEQGFQFTPSIVAFSNTQILVGNSAKRQVNFSFSFIFERKPLNVIVKIIFAIHADDDEWKKYIV
jgi:hypothetical protein